MRETTSSGWEDFSRNTRRITCAKEMTVDVEGKSTHSPRTQVRRILFRNVLKTLAIYAVMDLFGPAMTWKIAMAMRIFLSKKKKPYSAKVMEAFRRYARSNRRC